MLLSASFVQLVSGAGNENENGLAAERGKRGGAGNVRDTCGFGPDKAHRHVVRCFWHAPYRKACRQSGEAYFCRSLLRKRGARAALCRRSRTGANGGLRRKCRRDQPILYYVLPYSAPLPVGPATSLRTSCFKSACYWLRVLRFFGREEQRAEQAFDVSQC